MFNVKLNRKFKGLWRSDPELLEKIHKKYGLPAIAVIKTLKREIKEDGIPVMPAAQFLKGLFL